MHCGILTFILCFLRLHAQHEVSGTVSSSSYGPITYATLVLFQEIDSVLYKSSWTDEQGNFTIPQVASGNDILEVRGLSYVALSRKLTINNPITLEDLVLENTVD